MESKFIGQFFFKIATCLVNSVQQALSGDVILSIGEHNYADVLAALSDARQIECATFNLGRTADDSILKTFASLPAEARIRLLTNIPKRFDAYFYPQARAKAKEQIDIYVNRLSPENFRPQIEVRFYWKNHVKLFITENVGYVGSANLSEESSGNAECGVIFRGQEQVQKLRALFNELWNNGIAYHDFESNESLRVLWSLRERTRSVLIALTAQNLTEEWDNNEEEIVTRFNHDEGLTRNDAEFLKNLSAECFEAGVSVPEILHPSHSERIFGNNSALLKFGERESFLQSFFENLAPAADEDHIDEASTIANDQLHELLRDAEPEADAQIKELLTGLRNLLEAISQKLGEQECSSVIDNT